MAVNLFGKIKDRANEMRNKMTDSMVNDVKDLRNDEFKAQMQNARKQNDNLSLWDKYKRTGQKIDVPEFDAKIVDLPKADENEKEIKIDRTPQTSVPPSFVPTGRTDLEALAGNGLPLEEELPITEELAEPKGTSINIPREENPEWDLEDLAGNGQRETPKAEPMVEDVDDDLSIVDELHKDDPVGEVDEEGNLLPPKEEEPAEEGSVEEPEFDESDVADPEDSPDLLSDEEAKKIEEDAKAEEEQRKAEEEKQKAAEEEKKKQEEEKKKAEEEQKKNPEQNEDEDEDKDKEPTETVRTEQGPINDDTDLIKKGGGVDINEMVDRSQIPHYNYLSFFQ